MKTSRRAGSRCCYAASSSNNSSSSSGSSSSNNNSSSNSSSSNNNSSNNNIEQSCQPSMETLGALHSMLEESVASGRLPAPQQQATGLPQLSVQGLSVPTALMALLVRAHAHEHSVHVGNVACRLLPMGSSCATSGGVRGLQGGASKVRPSSRPRSSGARRGIVIHGLRLRDGTLTAHAVPDAISSVMGEAWALEEVPHGCELSACGPVLLLPTFADPHASVGSAGSRGLSAGRRLPSAHAGLSTSRGTSAAALAATSVLGGGGVATDISTPTGVGGPGSSQALRVPVALSKLGGMVGDAGGVVLHVDVRGPLAGSATPACAPPAARGLCFLMVMDEEWPADSSAVRALARD
uniref:Uncharacterized protein n=1 Tax=Dunaliella tertiolecta TaxID=3047 RepID=A0A7S3R0G2_DUNTE